MRVSGLSLGVIASLAIGTKADSDSPSTIDHPEYILTKPFSNPEGAVFYEPFISSIESRWKESHAKKAGAEDEFSYVGKWSVEEAVVYPGMKGDKGLVAKSPAAHHAITALFDKPLDNKGKTLVVQYEVKLQKGLECGGAYMKLLSENKKLHQAEFSNDTPYQIMFGPDKCGTTNKVHFIIRRKSPITGEYEEKHLVAPPPAKLTRVTNLYTLIINPDQTFEIRINGVVAKAGDLMAEGTFKPSLSPPKEIPDLKDEKPADWVDNEYMPDPEKLEKPADWDENAPFEIPDPKAVKPEDWNEDTPEFIPDPKAEIPDDWDTEEDGEWVAPEIPNPECEKHGCGVWKPLMIRNPDYKGKYKPPTIKNPDYKGPWSPRLIPNPNHYEDKTPSNLEPIGGIGFEIWTMQSDILFDHIYIGHSIKGAEALGNATYVPKIKIEEAEERKDGGKSSDPKKRKNYKSAFEFFKDDPVGYVVEVYRVFILNFSVDPFRTIQNQPLPALALVGAFFLVVSIFFGLVGVVLRLISGSSSAPRKDKKLAEKVQPEKDGQENSSTAAVSSSVSKETSATKRSVESK